MKIDQSSHVVLEATHHFIASAVQLVHSSDQFLAFAGEALEVTRTRIGSCALRRAAFCGRVLSFSHHRSSVQRVVPVILSGNRGGRTVRLPFGGESTSNGLSSRGQRASDHTARLCGYAGRNAENGT